MVLIMRRQRDLKGLVFIIGVVLVVVGIVIPFLIRMVCNILGVDADELIPILTYSYTVGTVLGLVFGLPMILLGIIFSYLKHRNR
jgi:hypothetical protein